MRRRSPPSADPGGPAAADPRCDPQVQAALAESAEQGVEDDIAIIRHPDQGIRDPDSILDFSCITDLFDYRAFDILFDPAGALDDILDLARRRICARRPRRLPQLSRSRARSRRLHGPGPPPSRLDIDRRRRNLADDIAGSADRERFRDIVEGGR